MRLQRVGPEELERLGGPVAVAAHVRALVPGGDSVEQAVSEIVRRVRDEGDAAVLDYTRQFDTARADTGSDDTGGHDSGSAGRSSSEGDRRPIVVAPEELDAAIKLLPLELVAGLQVTIANVAQVADAGVGADVAVELAQGQRIVLRELPVASAAVYVPGGRAPYPSTVAMGVVTARAAGVLDVAVCSPPGADGQIDSTILGACRLCGVERVYRMGGAQAVAALAYGTQSVARVDVIVGPGNLYVQEAKRQLSAIVGIDGFAGPSDLLVVLGADVGERELRLVALDMLAQAEHGEGSLVLAVSAGPGVTDALAERIAVLDAERPVGGAAFALIDAIDSSQALEIANAFAPEHLQLIGADVEALASKVSSAGCLFVGAESATAFGDYVAGSNHVLPTGGAARFASTLSPRHFRRRMAEVRIDANAALKLAKAGSPIARAEGFVWHARSMDARMGEN
jgi:histidinol dehydrogenase